MPGKGSEKFAQALKTASGGNDKRLRQARHVQKNMEKRGKSKTSAAKAAMAAAKGHIADGMSLEAALETALAELELPSGPSSGEWQDTPYPRGPDPREAPVDRPQGKRKAFNPPPPKDKKFK